MLFFLKETVQKQLNLSDAQFGGIHRKNFKMHVTTLWLPTKPDNMQVKQMV
jgi:hypothetical protein